MKKLFSIFTVMVSVLSLAACSDSIRNEIQSGSIETPLPIASEPSGGSDHSTMPDTQVPPLDTVERLGFYGGNIGAGGRVCGGDDGYVYYRSESDGWKLYRARSDGSDKSKVSDRIADRINVLDGWVYFLDFPEGFPIYKVRTDGTDEIKLVDGYCSNLYVAESGIYFDIRDENNIPHVYRADLDGGNMILLMPEAALMYYYEGKVYLGSHPFGVYDIETGEEMILDDTSVTNVSVDDSGIYYFAYEEGEFRHMDLDSGGNTFTLLSSNDGSVILRGGDFFNYANGNLYYIGISANAHGPCHAIYRHNIETGETVTLYEELNEYFDAFGNLIGVTFSQLQNGDYDPDIFEYNDQGEMVLNGGAQYLNESMFYVNVAGEQLYMSATLRESLIQNGRLDCIARLDGGVTIWD